MIIIPRSLFGVKSQFSHLDRHHCLSLLFLSLDDAGIRILPQASTLWEGRVRFHNLMLKNAGQAHQNVAAVLKITVMTGFVV